MLLPYFYLTILVDCKDNINLYFTKKCCIRNAFPSCYAYFFHFRRKNAPAIYGKFPENPPGKRRIPENIHSSGQRNNTSRRRINWWKAVFAAMRSNLSRWGGGYFSQGKPFHTGFPV